MNLITVLCFTSDDAAHAGALLDYLAALHVQPQGHLLLVAAPDVHGELVEKTRISAELAFASVDVLPVPWPQKNAQAGKYVMMNHVFRTAAATVAERYKDCWVWLEPDCVPLTPHWMESIRSAYLNQPHRYMGAVMRDPEGRMSMDRCGVYPVGAILQLANFFEQPAPFNLQAGDITVKRCTKSKLFQVMPYTATTERSKVREDACILHGDKEGVLLSAIREELRNKQFPYPVKIEGIAEIVTDPDFAEHAAPKDELTYDKTTNTTTLGDVSVPAVPPPPSLNANDPPKKKPGRPAKKTEPVAA